MKLTTPAQFWADIVDASGAADRQQREKLLRATAENLVGLTDRMRVAHDKYKARLKQPAKGEADFSLQPAPTIDPAKVSPADRAVDMNQKPMQIILLGVISKAVHNIGVGLRRFNGLPVDDLRITECRCLKGRLAKDQALLEFRSLAQWKDGLTYDEWWKRTCASLTADERVNMDATLRDTWAFVRAQFLGVKTGMLMDSESKAAILNSVATMSAQLHQAIPAKVVENRMGDFLRKYERPIAFSMATLSAGTAGAAIISQNPSLGGIAGGVAAGAAAGYATYRATRRTLHETEHEVEGENQSP